MMLLLLILGGLLFAWAKTDPHSLSFANDLIESRISSLFPGKKVEIGDSYMEWRDLAHPLDIKLRNIRVLDSEDKEQIQIPLIAVEFDIAKMLHGNLSPSELVMYDPIIKTSNDKDENVNNINLQDSIAKLFKHLQKLENINLKISIQNGKLQNDELGQIIDIKEAITIIDFDGDSKQIKSSINIGNNNQIELNSIFENNILKSKLSLQNIFTNELLQYLPDTEISRKIASFGLILSGDISFSIDDKAKLYELGFLFKDSSAEINNQDLFNDKVRLNDIAISGFLEDDFSKITIDNFTANINSSIPIKFSGMLKDPKKIDMSINEPAMIIQLEIGASDIETAKSLWPKILFPKSRDWVINNVHGGNISSLHYSANLLPRDILIKPMREEAVNGKIDFEDAGVTFLSNMPPIENSSGTINFLGNKTIITSEKGTLSKMDILNAKTIFENIGTPHVTGHSDVKLKGNITNFFPLIQLDSSKKIAGVKLSKINGDADIKLLIDYPIKPVVNFSEISVNGILTTENQNITDILDKYNLTQAKILAEYNGHDLTISGNGEINQIPSNFKITAPLIFGEHIADESFKPDITITSSLSKDDLNNFFKTQSFDFSGNIEANLNIREKISAKIDFTNSDFAIKDLNWRKTLGEKSSMSFDIYDNKISNILYLSDYESIKGDAMIDFDSNSLKSLALTEFALGRNNLTIDYNSNKIKISGNSADLSAVALNNWLDKIKSGKKDQLDIDINIKKIFMKNNILFENFSFNLKCVDGICENGQLNSAVNGKDSLNANFLAKNGGTSIEIISTDAGKIALALDSMKNIKKGGLTIHSIYYAGDKSRWSGEIIVDNFVVEKVNLLTKLLTLSSITGVFELLQGDNIAFSKMRGNFSMSDGIINIKEMRFFSNSIAMTANGNIYMRNKTLELEGAIVPGYIIPSDEVNNFLGKIPMLGKILTGPDKEGVLAANYRIKGNFDDPSIMVNPLSILTPGFFRSIFNITDMK